MAHYTSNTYTLKRKILTFSNKISKQLTKPERKFTADIAYGMLASNSCLLTDVVDQLHEDSKKINIVDRLSYFLINDSLALWEVLFCFKLQSTETQEKTSQKNWLDEDINTVLNGVIDFLQNIT